MNRKDIIDNVYFKYDYTTLYYVYKNYNYSFENAREILDNLCGIQIFNEKLNSLYDIYKDLAEKGLLFVNPLFSQLFKNKKVYVCGYSKNDLELNEALIKLGIQYEYLPNKNNNYEHDVYQYDSISDEIKGLMINIMKLISQGVPLNNIYLYKLPSEYEMIIKKYFRYHNIKIEGLNCTYLNESPIYKKYIDLLRDNNLIDAFNILSNETKNDKFMILDKISSILVDINALKLEKSEFVFLLEYISKNTKIREIKYDNSIKICDYDTILSEDDHVFMLGFSLDYYPKISKDTDFFTDSEKHFLNKNTSSINNQISEELLINFISNAKNMTISYSKKEGKKEIYPSLIINKLNMKIIKEQIPAVRYSLKLSQVEVADYLDNRILYGISNEYINTFSEEELGYKSYSHHFKGLDFVNDSPLYLSASSITTYNSCPFKYFIEKILKVGEFEETFYTKLGNVFHLILQDSIEKDLNIDDYEDVISSNFTTKKERILFDNLLPQVIEVINKNKDFSENSDFNNLLSEKSITIQIDDNSWLTGKIDKIMLDDENKDYIIVDYKTGSFTYDKKKNEFGIDLQLPIYSLLISKEFKDYRNIGIYIQRICLPKKDLLKGDIIPYNLTGVTLRDETGVKRLDHYLGSYDFNGNLVKKSKFINSVSIKNDTTLTATTGISAEDYEKLLEVALNQVNNAIENIRNKIRSSGNNSSNQSASNQDNAPGDRYSIAVASYDQRTVTSVDSYQYAYTRVISTSSGTMGTGTQFSATPAGYTTTNTTTNVQG